MAFGRFDGSFCGASAKTADGLAFSNLGTFDHAGENRDIYIYMYVCMYVCMYVRLNTHVRIIPEGTYIYIYTLTKPCFVLIGLVMFFNFANLDTKLMVAILGQDCSLVIQPFRFGASLCRSLSFAL